MIGNQRKSDNNKRSYKKRLELAGVSDLFSRSLHLRAFCLHFPAPFSFSDLRPEKHWIGDRLSADHRARPLINITPISSRWIAVPG
jgi:hypothetical protein